MLHERNQTLNGPSTNQADKLDPNWCTDEEISYMQLH